jgi:TetR/AcrR family transcriptional regulator, transcriptional repressor for nem operon
MILAMSAREPSGSTAERLLDVAERLVQTRGYNGFSYADIATELAVTKASLHYHFPTKAMLGRALIERYHRTFVRLLAAIDADTMAAKDKLARYAALYEAVFRADRMCLCGMLAAEYESLPEPMQEEVRRFFTANEVWLASVLEAGQRAGELRFRGKSLDAARLHLSALQGAMLVARSYRSIARFEASAKLLLADLTAPPRSRDRAGGRVANG